MTYCCQLGGPQQRRDLSATHYSGASEVQGSEQFMQAERTARDSEKMIWREELLEGTRRLHGGSGNGREHNPCRRRIKSESAVSLKGCDRSKQLPRGSGITLKLSAHAMLFASMQSEGFCHGAVTIGLALRPDT